MPLQIEIYEGSSVKYGDPNDFPDSSARLGSSVLTVAKTYISGEKFMFNINAPFMRDNFFNAPPNFGYIGFFDTGTLKRIRYDVRVNRGGNYQTIFRSGVKFLLNSYGRQVEPPYTLPGDGGSTDDMQFVYALEPTQLITVRTLTNTPPTFITTNGLIVLSFLFKNSAPGVVLSAAFNIYTQSGAYIDTIVFASIEAEDAGEVVSMMIPVFYLVYYYPNAGIIDAVIYANDTPRTYPKRYYVRPENLHETEYLMFLNQLGGWDCFNFDTIRTEEVRAERSTYAKGGILDNRLASAEMRRSFETVYNSEISKVYTLRSAPITDDVALWLEELAKSTVVYDKNNRYVIITDFALTISPENRDAQILTVKFKYSYEWQ